MLYLLSSASANTPMFARDLPLLLFLGVGIVLALMVLVGYQLLALRRRLQAGLFGSKLTLRLVLLFSLVAVLPGALVYSVSVQFLNKSIESWFDVRVEKALEGGLSLGRTTLDNMLRELNAQGRFDGACSLPMRAPAQLLATLNTLREQAAVHEATLFQPDGNIIAFSISEGVGADAQPAAGPGHAAGAHAAALPRDRVRGSAGAAVARGGARQRAVRGAGSAAAGAAGPDQPWRATPRRCRRSTRTTRSCPCRAAGSNACTACRSRCRCCWRCCPRWCWRSCSASACRRRWSCSPPAPARWRKATSASAIRCAVTTSSAS